MNVLEMGFGPTPLYLLDTDGNGNRIFIKREDLLPYSFGGNKVRIGIEYLRDMRKNGCDHMVAYGNGRSNLCRVLSNMCAGFGMPITIISPADDDGVRHRAANERLCTALGARMIPCLKTNVLESVEKVLSDIRQSGGKPYYIYGDMYGEGNKAVPAAAYAGVYAEIAGQEKALCANFEAVFLAMGTGMTQAGLLCGQSNTSGTARIVGLSIAREEASARSHVQAYIHAYAEEFGGEVTKGCIEVYDDFRESYGQHGELVDRCIHKALAQYGVPLDGTYTGKAFYGMGELIRHWGWRERDLLFIHTGGTPLFFDNESWGGQAFAHQCDSEFNARF